MKNFIRATRTTPFIFAAIAAGVLITALAACAGRPVSSAPAPPIPWNKDAKKTMRAFGSEEELKSYFRKLVEERKKEMARGRREANANPPSPMGLDQASSNTTLAKTASGYA